MSFSLLLVAAGIALIVVAWRHGVEMTTIDGALRQEDPWLAPGWFHAGGGRTVLEKERIVLEARRPIFGWLAAGALFAAVVLYAASGGPACDSDEECEQMRDYYQEQQYGGR